MDKIYIVTSGEYSDYSIDGAFSSEENAQLYIDQFAGGKGYYKEEQRIEVFDIDIYSRQIKDGLKIHTIIMDKDGNVLEREKMYQWNEHGYPGDEVWKWILNKTDTPDLMVDILAKDEIHAIKIVNEQRTELIALDSWPSKGSIAWPKTHFWGSSFQEFKQETRDSI